jgi:hypothetical protein
MPSTRSALQRLAELDDPALMPAVRALAHPAIDDAALVGLWYDATRLVRTHRRLASGEMSRYDAGDYASAAEALSGTDSEAATAMNMILTGTAPGRRWPRIVQPSTDAIQSSDSLAPSAATP